MSGFSAAWLRLREPLDFASRPEGLAVEFASARRARSSDGHALWITDLGAGTGSNLRYLAPRIGGSQRWQLVDQDAELLGLAVPALRAWAESMGSDVRLTESGLIIRNAGFECDVRCVSLKLDCEMDRLSVPEGGLVCGSALLDLVSDAWLTALAERCRDASAMVWFALTYDGRMDCEPLERDDELVRDLVNRHQLGDKGFGPALGPRASDRSIELFAKLGYVVRKEPSDWRIDGRFDELQRELIEGWFGAAQEVKPDLEPELLEWRARRLRHVETGHSSIIVGHTDIVGLPRNSGSLSSDEER